MLQLYLDQSTKNLFLHTNSAYPVDCDLHIENGKWYYFVMIVNLFDIQKV